MKNRTAYRLLFTANTISGLAQGITMLAIPWYFSKVLNQPELFGWLYALTTIIMLFWGLYAGTLIDRYSRKWVFVGINAFGALLLGLVSAYGYWSGDVGTWGAMAVFSGTILIYNIHYPALYAFGQEITERAYYGRFTSMTEVIGQSTSILSGAAGALLLSGLSPDGWLPEIEPWSLHQIFLADALTYALSIVLIVAIRYTPISTRKPEEGSVWKRIGSGIAFLRQHPLVFLFGNASYAIFIVLLITVQQLLPLYTDQHLQAGAGSYALAEFFYSLGAMLAGLGIVRLFRTKGLPFGVLVMMALAILIYLLAATTRNTTFYFFLSVLLGLSNAGARVLRTTWIFQHVPNQTIGRVSSVFQSLNILFRSALSAVFALPFFNHNGNVRYAYFICALVVAGFMLPLLINYRKIVGYKGEGV
jgi:DHA3 family macrolide efflux protein-like MFS transporter